MNADGKGFLRLFCIFVPVRLVVYFFIIRYFMNAKNKEQYEAPVTSVVELNSAGFLCQSPNGMNGPDDYSEGGDPLSA